MDVVEKLAGTIVYRKCDECGDEQKYPGGHCGRGCANAMTQMQAAIKKSLAAGGPERIGGLRMPDGYKPHPVSDGGVGSGVRDVRRVRMDDAERTFLRFCPAGFIDAYERLIDAGVGEQNLGSAGGIGGELGTVLGGGGERRGGGQGLVRSERFVEYRRRLDKRLRRISREILAELNPDSENGSKIGVPTVRICSGKCKKIGDVEWLFCARCGGPMREKD